MSPRFLSVSALVVSLLGAGPASAFVWPNVSEQVARGLASSDLTERRQAAQRLADLPPETALPLVQTALGDPDVEVRLYAAQGAVAARLPKAGDRVIPWLAESDARLRLAATDVIREAPTERSVVALGRVLGDPDAHVRRSAAMAMGASGLPDAVSPLLGHLDDTAAEVREEVARALGRIGDARAVVPVIGKVQDSVPEVRKVVARALGELGDKRAAGALMLALQDVSPDVRLEAVGALGRLRSDDATAAIAPLLDDNSSARGASGAGAAEVRAAAVRALGLIGSPAAIKVLVAALEKDDRFASHSPVREALALAGKAAVPALVSALQGSPSRTLAAGAALSLAGLHDKAAGPPIVKAMQRGVLPVYEGLRALALLGDDGAVPAVLELLDDAAPLIRREAIRAAAALLDPQRPDGRPIDPARHALGERGTLVDEKIELCRLLGRTGVARAQDVLLPYASSKHEGLRLTALEALGSLGASNAAGVGSAAVDKVLLDGLDDESPRVRLKAGLALGRVATAAAAPVLLDRLLVAAEQDRGALGLALGGALGKVTDPALVQRVAKAVGSAPQEARDALLEGLGRVKLPEAGAALVSLSAGSLDDRRKVAEVLASHGEALDALVKLTQDADAGVRANAVWSLGKVGKKDQAAALGGLLKDSDSSVAANAAGALGLVLARASDAAGATAALCPVLADPRAYVRANALEGLSLAGARCNAGLARDLLLRDPAQPVRIAAADHLARQTKPDDADARALLRCASEDHDSAVAARCAKPVEAIKGVTDVSVYVIPDARDTPEPRAAFALVRADGLVRLGVADRRGAILESATPIGTLRLGVPAALLR